MDIQIGDLVTFKNNKDGSSFIDIITRETISQYYKKYLQKEIEILKIERPKYEVVEEKKDLLTDEEKEFLKDICKYYNIDNICFYDNYITFKKNDIPQLSPIYPENIKFINVEKWRNYTLKELGLEEN